MITYYENDGTASTDDSFDWTKFGQKVGNAYSNANTSVDMNNTSSIPSNKNSYEYGGGQQGQYDPNKGLTSTAQAVAPMAIQNSNAGPVTQYQPASPELNTFFVSGMDSLITTGVSFFIMPAFSAAIAGRVLPNNAI